MLTWAQYRANHPEVLASWGQQNGRAAKCWCPRCAPYMAAQEAEPGTGIDVYSFGAGEPPAAAEMYRAAIASALGAGRGVALHTVLTQMHAEPDTDLHDLAAGVERELAAAAVAAARASPEVMAELLALVRRAYPDRNPPAPDPHPEGTRP